jgi:hypothetical protein
MAATYNVSLPILLDQARFLFHDKAGATVDSVVVTKPLLLDEEYLGAMAAWGAIEGLAKLAEALASEYVQKVSKYANTRSGTSVEWPSRADFYLKLAASIRTNGISGTVAASAAVYPFPSPCPTLARDGSIKPPDQRLEFL